MSTPEQQFRAALAALLRDLRTDGKNDPEAMAMVGSLASALVEKAGADDWRSLKLGMTRETYDGLLRDFREQGNAWAKAGRLKQAYAAQVLGYSLVARTQLDPQLQEADRLLDEIVELAIALWKAHQAAPKH